MQGDRFGNFRCPIGYKVLPSICAECKRDTCIKNPKFKVKESLGEKTPVKQETNQLDSTVPKSDQNA